MSEITHQEFINVINQCRNIYDKKFKDYGCAWRILRLSSLTDQIYIKANRIRCIETKGNQKVQEGVISEFIGIINYSIMALVQIELGVSDKPDLTPERSIELYEKYAREALNLMENKNHDYDEAWRSMRVSSLTDIILMKLLRLKQIENNNGNTIASEGPNANYMDIINYAVFALIKLKD